MQASENDDKDYMTILEQAELMEELENELDQLNIDDEHAMEEYLKGNSLKILDDNSDDPEIYSEEFLAIRQNGAHLNVNEKIKFYEKYLRETQEYFVNNIKVGVDDVQLLADKRATEENLQNAIEELREEIETVSESSDDVGSVQSTESASEKQPNAIQSKIVNSEQQQEQQQQFQQIRSTFCNGQNNRSKPHSREDFERVEREYSEQNRSKSELLVFYKSQLRSVMKSFASCSIDANRMETDEKRNLYEYVCDRIDQLRAEILKENQIKLEEKFVDDDDIDCNGGHCLDLDANCLSYEMDDNEDDDGNNDGEIDANGSIMSPAKRRISFASQPSITVYHGKYAFFRFRYEIFN